ncbi:methylenetetrahydrofolate reductase [NAD(P)H] [Eubacterium sp.]|uniref:methylenetetrahydrofolate reductase [NAD(P)H] n=1 Tax=Eubacterium sp. TaxID=142586 RepID=UPI0025D1435C|nr:methylenetetrahydrofolate reductase [NAD(P)H] [Eubacterium sp.]MCR5629665.1 methylenetetrahydrofolate reductase [NAD(P)H] [Eubacterium sp.]
MQIAKLFDGDKTVLSYEIFPPKRNDSIDKIYDTIEELSDLNPDFISVTYGAGGNIADSKTADIAQLIKDKYNIESVAHLTCINTGKEELDYILNDLESKGIENILALRGDINPDIKPKKEFKYASELATYIIKRGGFYVSGACYPEVHVEAEDSIADIKNLKKKVDCGVSHLISQLFFDNEVFYAFKDRARAADINVPIEAGIMPVTNKKQIERMVTLCGASLPAKFVKVLQKYEDKPEALVDAGIAYAVNQIVDLVANGVDGIHLYTMNNPYVARKITESVKNIL